MPHDQIPSERPATLQSIVRSILFLQLWHLVGSWCTVPLFARQTTRNIPVCHLMKSGSRTGGGPRPYQTFSIFRCRENVSIIYHLEHYRRRRVNVGHELVGLTVTFIVYYGEARKCCVYPFDFLTRSIFSHGVWQSTARWFFLPHRWHTSPGPGPFPNFCVK